VLRLDSVDLGLKFGPVPVQMPLFGSVPQVVPSVITG
jgi:hypothetical protein